MTTREGFGQAAGAAGERVDAIRHAPEPHGPRVLIGDDEPESRDALSLLLRGDHCTVETAGAPLEVLAAAEAQDFDVAIVDLACARAPIGAGLNLLAALQAADPLLPVVVTSTWVSTEVAAEALRRGARDVIQKPWEPVRLLSAIRTQAALGRALRRARRLEAANRLLRHDEDPAMVSASPAMQSLLQTISRAGRSDVSILLLAERGVEAAPVARALHAASARASGPFIAVGAGSVAESELAGRLLGETADSGPAGPGCLELADGGTLFLDEIASLSARLQAVLVNVVETGLFTRPGASRPRRLEVRLIVATGPVAARDIARADPGKYPLRRLNPIEVEIPALRERGDDLPIVADRILQQHARRLRKRLTGFDPAALQRLLDYEWPGNVRELDHVIERAAARAAGPLIRPEDLDLRSPRAVAVRLEDMTLDAVESFLIRKAVSRSDGNMTLAARALGVSRSALYRRLQRHGI